MKNFTLLVLLLTIVGVTGCKKDSEETQKKDIVGKWFTKKMVYSYYENGKLIEQETDTDFDNDDYIEFKSNGKAFDDEGTESNWKISGNKLIVSSQGDEETFDIKQLTSKDAVLYSEHTNGTSKNTVELTLKK